MIVEDLELLPKTEPERRQAPRPEPPAPSLAPRMRRFVDRLGDTIEASWRGWTGFFLFCAACIGFICWSLTSRFELIEENQALVFQRAALQRTFDELAAHYSSDELQELLEKISSAETTVFSDYASLAGWLAELADSARARHFRLSYVMHETVSAQIKDVGEVPITLNLRPEDGWEQQSHDRMLGFLGEMIGTRWHLEIVDAAVQGDGEDVVSVDTTVHVWMEAA